MEHLVYLNGEYLPLSQAKISVLDRGFLFGDGVYEVMPWYQGRFLGFKAHIDRLNQSLSGIRLAAPYTQAQWLEILLPLMDNTRNQYIYLQVTRGVAPKRDHLFPHPTVPTVFAMCNDIPPFLEREQGIQGLTIEDNRWARCNIKATALLANLLLKQQAADADCGEAILVKNGYVTEGSASNVFAVIDGVLMTAPKSPDILAGITREIILELAQAHHIPFSEQAIPVAALKTASEIWVASSTREIVPIVLLDGEMVADGKAGAVWHKMNTLYQAYKQQSDV
jgi:D-alanine transaminase